MNPYIEALKRHLAEKPPDYGYADANSLLDILYYFYTELNPVDNSAIRQRFGELGEFLDGRTLEEQDRIFGLLCGIYEELERQAFFDGFYVGLRLAAELE